MELQHVFNMSDSVGQGKQKLSVASIGTPIEQPDPKRQKKDASSAGSSGSGRVVTEK